MIKQVNVVMMIGIRQSIIAHYPQLILWLRFPTIPQNHSTSFDMYKSITIYMVKSKLNNAKYIGFVERTTFISSLPLHGLKRWFFFFLQFVRDIWKFISFCLTMPCHDHMASHGLWSCNFLIFYFYHEGLLEATLELSNP